MADKKTVNKQQRLKEIDEKIKQASGYLSADPDVFAKSRVDALSKNPCLSGIYYLNRYV